MFSFVIKYWVQILFSLIVSLITHLYKKIYNYIKEINTLEDYACAFIKLHIMEMYEKINDRGYLTIEEKEGITEVYDIYKKLKCSNVVKDLIQSLDKFPIK